MNTRIALIISALTIAGCSTTPNFDSSQVYADFQQEHQLEQLKSINAFRLHGWSELDNQHLIIKTSPSKPYLITLKTKCHDLDFAYGIAIDQGTSSRLEARFDSIFVPRSPGQKCFIDTIHRLDKEQVKELRKRLDLAKSANQTPEQN